MLKLPPVVPPTTCKVCRQGPVLRRGAVDFNKVAASPPPFPHAGIAVEYWQCTQCGFAWAPAFDDWNDAQFHEHIYNDGIRLVETEANAHERTNNIFGFMQQWFAKVPLGRTLDYGCGPGKLVERLRGAGFDAAGYDRFYDGFETPPQGQFDVITCFEVMEHINRIDTTIEDMIRFLAPDGLLILGTFLADKPMDLDWWYCSPRSGHISFWTFRALSIAFHRYKLNVASDGRLFHFVFPDAAKPKIQTIFGVG